MMEKKEAKTKFLMLLGFLFLIAALLTVGTQTNLITGAGFFSSSSSETCVNHTILDFEQASNGSQLLLGSIIDDEFEGVKISASNGNPSHPDLAIIFNSSDPTGFDFDLETPGWGPGNNISLKNILIIAEDDVDSNSDGRVDDPDDEASGGIIFFNFTKNTKIENVTFIDIDTDETNSNIKLYDENDTLLAIHSATPLGDNSLEQLDVDQEDVRRIEIHFDGSAAVDNIGYCVLGPDCSEDEFCNPLCSEGEDPDCGPASCGTVPDSVCVPINQSDTCALATNASPCTPSTEVCCSPLVV